MMIKNGVTCRRTKPDFAMNAYAEQYSKREKLLWLVITGGCGVVLYAFATTWFFPAIQGISERPHCYHLYGISLGENIWYLLLVVVPLSLFLLFAFLIPKGINGWRQGQFPPKGTKVFRPTRIKFGVQARLLSLVTMAFPLTYLTLAVWGYVHAAGLSPVDLGHLDVALCEMPVQQ